jgi:uncharacterized protein (TIGR00290 family)
VEEDSNTMPAALALSWSGGKDSALALRALKRDGFEVRALVTTVTEEYDRVSMHGVRGELVRRHAASLGISLVEVSIPPNCPNEVYEKRFAQALASAPLSDLATVAFGDLFLADVRAYREERLASVGKRALFPLWGRNTTELAHRFVADGFTAHVVCLDPRRMPVSAAGRAYDASFLAELPADVDPCGEKGEFHTFVSAGPLFSHPIECTVGKAVERDGFVFCDLRPRAQLPPESSSRKAEMTTNEAPGSRARPAAAWEGAWDLGKGSDLGSLVGKARPDCETCTAPVAAGPGTRASFGA